MASGVTIKGSVGTKNFSTENFQVTIDDPFFSIDMGANNGLRLHGSYFKELKAVIQEMEKRTIEEDLKKERADGLLTTYKSLCEHVEELIKQVGAQGLAIKEIKDSISADKLKIIQQCKEWSECQSETNRRASAGI